MRYRKLGKSGIDVSVVAMGCWAIIGDATWGKQEEKESIETIEAAYDAGITFFDTAEGYGNGYSEHMLGKVFSGRRDRVVIGSKVSPNHCARQQVRAACERSLRNLGTDYIDVYMIHWPSREIPFADTMGELEKLKAEGKIRAIGVSNFGVKDLSGLLAAGRCEVNQLAYSMLFRAIEYGIRDVCADNEIGILCYSPLMQGLLTGKFDSADQVPEGRARTRHFSPERPQAKHGEANREEETFEAVGRVREIAEEIGEPMADVALAWLLHRRGVTSVLAGARHPGQARQNAQAGDLILPDDVMQRLTEATDPLKESLGPNPDMWLTNPRIE